jgi:hypothetical protein
LHATCSPCDTRDRHLARRQPPFLRDELGVSLHPEKTRIVHVDHGFEFLGYKVKRGKGLRLSASKRTSQSNPYNLYAVPREKSVTRFKDQIRNLVCAAQVAPSAGAIIGIGKLSDVTWPRKGTSPVSTFVRLSAGGEWIRTSGSAMRSHRQQRGPGRAA